MPEQEMSLEEGAKLLVKNEKFMANYARFCESARESVRRLEERQKAEQQANRKGVLKGRG